VDETGDGVANIHFGLAMHVGIGGQRSVSELCHMCTVVLLPLLELTGDSIHATVATGSRQEVVSLGRPNFLGGGNVEVSPPGAPACPGKRCAEPV
jgi:hypothetical protein